MLIVVHPAGNCQDLFSDFQGCCSLILLESGTGRYGYGGRWQGSRAICDLYPAEAKLLPRIAPAYGRCEAPFGGSSERSG